MNQPTWIGRTLSGRYRIEALLGQGGMSAVYKATDPNLKRVVAVKLIHPHLSSDPSFVIRFESEASAVASLRHPNIVQVFDFNNDGGVYYMVLEFIPGETLHDRMQRLNESGRKLSIKDALNFTINICEAVGYAHQRGLVHRDIKPANIMLDVYGQAILMDFGIVKILGGDSHTSTGALVGTARYMSPELIRGEVADHRSDIYSLGVTLYEMLSGRPPFVADSAMTLMMMHLNDPIPNVREFRTDVPPELVEILEKSLAKDRADRYQSTAEMVKDLKRALAYLGGQPTSNRLKDTGRSQAPATMVETPSAVQPVPPASATVMESKSVKQPVVQTVLEPAPVPGGQSQPLARPTTASTTAPPVSAPTASRRYLWIGGAGVIGLLCLAGLFFAGNYLLKGVASRGPDTLTPTIAATNTSAATVEQVVAPLASETSALTEPPTEAPTPTETLPPLYVRINSITVNDTGHYVVEYETFGYTEQLPGMHVHFFFNTVPPEQAGSPGSGPWYLYGGPRPFTKYSESDRPANATQMCALVANKNHSVIPDSGNCMNLP
ncbi:MAG TPA: protein kinase [Anaerolineales bacterium]|nr:protein kinase [Anaerolineales bacterium]